jgi:hypothetical protein
VNAALAAQAAFGIAGEILYGSGIWPLTEARDILDRSGLRLEEALMGLTADMDLLRTTI